MYFLSGPLCSRFSFQNRLIVISGVPKALPGEHFFSETSIVLWRSRLICRNSESWGQCTRNCHKIKENVLKDGISCQNVHNEDKRNFRHSYSRMVKVDSLFVKLSLVNYPQGIASKWRSFMKLSWCWDVNICRFSLKGLQVIASLVYPLIVYAWTSLISSEWKMTWATVLSSLTKNKVKKLHDFMDGFEQKPFPYFIYFFFKLNCICNVWQSI